MQNFLRSIAVTCLCIFALPAWAAVCDVDTDQDIDRLDIGLIFAARNQPANGPDDPRDADGNGFINVLDARICVLQCSLAGCAIPIANAPDAAKFDVTDDGNIDADDRSLIEDHFGLQAGQAGYREGLDLVPDGVIDNDDIAGILAQFGSTGVTTDGTTISGRVFDGQGNPLEGVKVKKNPPGSDIGTMAFTDKTGRYKLSNFPKKGEKQITFDGSGAVDPTPDFLSGKYPTIPNKPIFVNGGISNKFRDMSLPERDLTGSVILSEPHATDIGNNAWTLNEDVSVHNAGVTLDISMGCTAKFPTGEEPVLSITRVNPSMLPVPMPPGLSSSLFVTYQPGGTEVVCPAGGPGLSTTFDNSDGYVPGNGPFLAGITNGVFTELAGCAVNVVTDQLNCGPIPLPFDFAWYHVDIRDPVCARTTAVGTVLSNGVPVAGASVSIPGLPVVRTADDGTFGIPNVPAGPNGPLCFNDVFSLRASAAAGADFGISAFTPAVPGGVTDMGDIKFGVVGGTVQGSTLKLTSILPFEVQALPKAKVDVNTVPFPGCCPKTNDLGKYQVSGVPAGEYGVSASFEGVITEPDGDESFARYFDFDVGDIAFDGAVQVKDFRFSGTGAVQLTVRDVTGAPIRDALVSLSGLGGQLGQGFESPRSQCFGQTDPGGEVTLSSENGSCFAQGGGEFSILGVPQGPCEITVLDAPGNLLTSLGPEDGCFINQVGELLELEVEAGAPP